MKSKITEMNKKIATELGAEVIAALNSFFAGRNIRVSRGNGTYSATELTFKITLGVDVTATGKKALTKEERDYATYPNMPALGTSFTKDGKAFTIVGARPRCYARPIICASGSMRYKFSPETIKIYTNLSK